MQFQQQLFSAFLLLKPANMTPVGSVLIKKYELRLSCKYKAESLQKMPFLNVEPSSIHYLLLILHGAGLQYVINYQSCVINFLLFYYQTMD